ncbi:hypothetical protein PM082_024379 [Marasmius tenuissimus]|nr:hypothetical protein PM082_024379 [Marasmius tenuissimus]
MGSLLAPLREAGVNGIILASGDGVKRRCHPILAAHVANYPEQILATCSYYRDCPLCLAEKKNLEQYPPTADFRNPTQAIHATQLVGKAEWSQACLDANIKPIQHPFWEDLPYTDIFRSITPDLLHQLYQGVMKHLIQWITDIVGEDEIDARVRRLPANHGIWHFHKGITSLSRISGLEHKQMCTFLLNLILDAPRLLPSRSKMLLTSTRALLDFLYLACYPIHSNDSLTSLEASLAKFHENKAIFIELGETTERLHIDFAKDAYRASNGKDEYAQMTRWLERREKVIHHTNYLEWRDTQPTLTQSLSHHPTEPSPTTEMRYTIPGSQRSLSDMMYVLSPQLSRFPTVKTVALTKLVDSVTAGGYGATHIEYAIKEFISRHRGLTNEGQVQDMAHFLSLPFRSVQVWHKIKFRNEELYGPETLDVVAAQPRRFGYTGHVTQVSHFDAALIRFQNAGTTSSSAELLRGLQIGRVRIIFALPGKHFSRLFAPGTKPTGHLAYVEWFNKFSVHPEPNLGLYRVKPLLRRDGSQAFSVLPVETIQQSANLYPKWGGAVPPNWSREFVLDTCTTFYLSPFKNTRMYFNTA